MTDLQLDSNQRELFRCALENGDVPGAIRAARGMLAPNQGVSIWSAIRKAILSASGNVSGLRPLKVALLSSFSSEFVHDPLVAYAFLEGIRVEIYQAGFGQYRQEILDAQSALYKWEPDIVILAVEGEDWSPSLYHGYLAVAEIPGETLVKEAQAVISNLVRIFRKRSTAVLLIHNLSPPIWRTLGILDENQESGQTALVDKLNSTLRALGRELPGVYLVDYAGLVTRFGAVNWFDVRMAHYAKAPIARPMLGHLAKEYTKFFRALTGKSKKCLVVDFDNTLWGGVVGEDGVNGIKLGSSYPGSVYRAFQEELLSLHRRGVMLAAASKNNESDVCAVFASNDQMVLRREHFSAWKVNWSPKSVSIIEIAKELNIGLEHIVFVDDNHAECEQVSLALPLVTVIALPKQPEQYIQAILDGGLFDRLTLSEEDRRRGELYQQRAGAEALREESKSLEEFYRSLEMEVVFAPVDQTTLPRAAQLTQKTNQFNTTTIRYSEPELSAKLEDPSWLLTSVRARDKFGDNGIVGLMIAHVGSGTLEIETFLLSCRVIGRTVETAMLTFLAQQALARNLEGLSGEIIPTAKNMPVQNLYALHGFREMPKHSNGTTFWLLDVNAMRQQAYPLWIKVVETKTEQVQHQGAA